MSSHAPRRPSFRNHSDVAVAPFYDGGLLSLLLYHLVQFGWTGFQDLQGWLVHRRIERNNVLFASSESEVLFKLVREPRSLDQLAAFLDDDALAKQISGSYRSELVRLMTEWKHERGVERRVWILDYSMPFAFAVLATILDLLSIFGVPAEGRIALFSGAIPA